MSMTRKPEAGAERRSDPKKGARVSLDRLAVVAAEGHVDRAGLEACDYLIMRAGPDLQGAVVDLSEATHLDYRATVLLVARRRVLKAKGAELAVAAGRRNVRDIIRASAGGELPVFTTVDEALAWVRGDGDTATVGAATARAARVR